MSTGKKVFVTICFVGGPVLAAFSKEAPVRWFGLIVLAVAIVDMLRVEGRIG